MGWKDCIVPWDALADRSCPAPPPPGGSCPPSTWQTSGWVALWPLCRRRAEGTRGASGAGTPLPVLQRALASRPALRLCDTSRSPGCADFLTPGSAPARLPSLPAPLCWPRPGGQARLLFPPLPCCADFLTLGSAPARPPSLLTPLCWPIRVQLLFLPLPGLCRLPHAGVCSCPPAISPCSPVPAQLGAAALPPALAPCALWLGRPPTPSSCGILPESSF